MAAEFEVTLSAMTDAATNIKNLNEQFVDEANQTYQAAQTLNDGWKGDASDTFLQNMEQLHKWMNEMAEVLDTYVTELNASREKYENADVSAAKNFAR